VYDISRGKGSSDWFVGGFSSDVFDFRFSRLWNIPERPAADSGVFRRLLLRTCFYRYHCAAFNKSFAGLARPAFAHACLSSVDFIFSASDPGFCRMRLTMLLNYSPEPSAVAATRSAARLMSRVGGVSVLGR
jgi:hypothetical protein